MEGEKNAIRKSLKEEARKFFYEIGVKAAATQLGILYYILSGGVIIEKIRSGFIVR